MQKGQAEAALQRLREIMGKLKLTVNEEKACVCEVPEGEFDFLGYTSGRTCSDRKLCDRVVSARASPADFAESLFPIV